MLIRAATAEDADAIWAILSPIIAAGETYALPRDMTREAVLAYWQAPGHEVFMGIGSTAPIGTYYLRKNQQGGGGHVANAAFATDTAWTGKGVARALCAHAMDHARARGFRAMQFNFVVASNARAVALWQDLGFAVVGRIPSAFAHPSLGDVDALVMYQTLCA